MEKNIKDYLHLYLGCDAFVFLDEVITDGWLEKQLKAQPNLQYSIRIQPGSLGYIISNGYKPILRPLSDMTEEEALEVAENILAQNGLNLDDWSAKDIISAYVELWDRYTPEETKWLLSKGFDLFGLIDAGLAIDKTIVKDTQR